MCVCVSCLCRPPSHWWISFIFYTIIGLDPEGGQWLFKFKSNHNKKFNPQNAKQYMWDSSINLWSRKHTNSDTVVGFENEMVSHAHARLARHSRVFTPEFGDSLDSRQLLQLRARPHSNVFCGIVSPKLTRVHGNATCKFELPKLGKIYLS